MNITLAPIVYDLQGLPGADCVKIGSLYDSQLIEDIKEISWKQRFFDKNLKAWIVLKRDPNLPDGELDNLAYVRKVAQECAERRAWIFQDFTEISKEEKAAQIAQQQLENLEAHVKAMREVFKKLPPHSLRVVKWERGLIKFQLTQWTDENLWNELKTACLDIWKPAALVMSSSNRMDFGFVFEMSADARNINALIACQGVENLKVHKLFLIDQIEDGGAHFEDAMENLFIGVPVAGSDMDEISWSTQPWEIAEIGGEYWWVANAKNYIQEWLGEQNFTVFYKAVFNKEAKLPAIINQFCLEDWFDTWAKSLFEHKEIKLTWRGRKHIESDWEHPADKIIDFLSRFREKGAEEISSLINLPSLNQRIQEIKNLKEKEASEHLQKLRENAIDIVVDQVVEENSKDLLLRMAGSSAKKSWSKEKIARTFIDQEYAEKKLRIKNR